MIDTVEINDMLELLKNNPSEGLESETVEFKEYQSPTAFHNASQDIITELVAFANKSGGVLIVGVKDSNNVVNGDWPSQLVGFDELDCLEVNRRIRGNLNPAITLVVSNHSFEGKNYLLINVPHGRFGLVMTVRGKCYMRSGRDSNPMTPQEVADKIKSSNGFDWTSDIVPLDPDDALDDQQIEEVMLEYKSLNDFGEATIPQQHFLERIGITNNGQLTKAGLLFVGKPEFIQEHVGRIEYRFSKREGGGKLPINEVWSGSVWSSISRIRDLLKQEIKYSEFVCDDKTYTFPSICRKSFEEALINSLIHRDYSLEGMTTVELDGSFVTIKNPGEFYGGVTATNIFTHPPRHRNPTLASILMNFELVDRAGMGTRRMNIGSLRLGRRQPMFSCENNSVSTILELGVVKEGVFVVASPFADYDVAELFLLNLLYGNGYERITSVVEKIGSVVSDPWAQIRIAMDRLSCLSLVGNKNGIYLVVNESHRAVLRAYRKVRIYSSSNAYVAIYQYLKSNGEATANELYEILNLESLDKTRRLLREAKFIEKIQNDVDVTWRLE